MLNIKLVLCDSLCNNSFFSFQFMVIIILPVLVVLVKVKSLFLFLLHQNCLSGWYPSLVVAIKV